MDNPPNFVLFICGHNAGRSQMAQAFFNSLRVDFPNVASQYAAISVGTRPGTQLNPMVVTAMGEVGIDLTDASEYFPKGMDNAFIQERGDRIRRAIVACDDQCVLPENINATMEHWNLPDPHGQPIEKVREVSDLVKEKVIALLEELNES